MTWYHKWLSQLKLPLDTNNIKINDIIIKFQDSYIDKNTVDKYNQNYIENKVLWISDCSKSVRIKELSNNRFMINFIEEKDYWKYDSFINCDYILLDYNEKIFKVNPKNVKDNMIDVYDYKYINILIKRLKNNKILFDEDIMRIPKLYHNQRGAGCGKTYESIQLLENTLLFSNKKIFIFLTKMHSVREVIYNELIEQYNRGALPNIKIIKKYEIGKQYVITYINNLTNENNIIIIGTIDSFIFSLGKNYKNDNDIDFFGSMAKAIRDVKIDLSFGSIKYAKNNIELSEECLIIVDEAQDLEPHYIEALSTIMRSTSLDAYIIGDKLQSLMHEINTHTFLEKSEDWQSKGDLPNIDIIRDSGKNIVKRFHNHHFIELVNRVINFADYNLPEITDICDGNCKYKHTNDIPYHIFFLKKELIRGQLDESILYENIKIIIDNVDNEVNKNNYLPKHFMFIFPILKNNYFASMLEIRLQEYWINKFKDSDYQNNVLSENKYNQYVFLHKSEEGKPINLKLSENSSKILSIHASKGNGCEVVFLLGVSESSLKKFSDNQINIKYESLLHVGITRQKIKLYVGLTNLTDNIAKRFHRFFPKNSNINIMPPIENIKININSNTIINNLSQSNYVKDILAYFPIVETNRNFLFNNDNENDNENEKQNNIIDWGHHIIRRCVFEYCLLYNISKISNKTTNDSCKGNQFIAMLNKFKDKEIKSFKYKDYLKKLEEIYKDNCVKEKDKQCNEIPLLQFTDDNNIYKRYEVIIIKIIEKIQEKIKNSKALPKLCAIEIIILYHCLEVIKCGYLTEITIFDIYNIVYYYDECSNEIDEKHQNNYKCLCKTEFTSNNNNESNKYQDIRKSIIKHYEKTKQVDETFTNFTCICNEKYHNVSRFHFVWKSILINKIEQNNFKIYSKYDIIGYSNDYTIYFKIQPSLNKLNYNEIIFNIILNVFLIGNLSEEYESNSNYSNKKIVVCLLTLDSINPLLFTFDITEEIKNKIIGCIKEYIIDDYTKKHEIIIDFINYCKNINKEPYDYLIENKLNKNLPNYILDIIQELQYEELNDDQIYLKLNRKLNIKINDIFRLNCKLPH